MHSEEKRILLPLPGTFRIGVYVINHRPQLPLMGEDTVKWDIVVNVSFESEFSGFRLTTLHVSADHFLDAASHASHHLKHHVVMVGHDLVR